MAMNGALRAGMLNATQLVREGGLLEATATIQRTLRSMVMSQAVPASSDSNSTPPIEGVFHGVHEDAEAIFADVDVFPPQDLEFRTPCGTEKIAPRLEPGMASGGRFITCGYTNHAGSREYKLYIPRGYRGQALPLIVMLHGCTQDPDDFATGTRMNELAEQRECFVLYPMQAQAANGQKCWNWFRASDQHRDRGEPAIIAGITREIMGSYCVDARRVFVAGLSAGGAMAVIMGTTYPDLFAAVGVHSGLPYAVAHDLPSALTAMKQGAGARRRPVDVPEAGRPQSMPTIVFHGDRDTKVHPRNGDQVIAQRMTTHLDDGAHNGAPDSRVTIRRGQIPGGHAYVQAVHHDENGKIIMEQWRIHGAGHAWSGGSPNGSYTDPKGPNAAQEMIRFFYAHPRREET